MRAQIRRLRIVAGFSMTLLLAGCLSLGQEFPAGRAQELRIGETSQAEVQRIFGDPPMTGVADGNPSWTYLRVRYSAFSGATAEYLEVQFDEQGRLASYSLNRTP